MQIPWSKTTHKYEPHLNTNEKKNRNTTIQYSLLKTQHFVPQLHTLQQNKKPSFSTSEKEQKKIKLLYNTKTMRKKNIITRNH